MAKERRRGSLSIRFEADVPEETLRAATPSFTDTDNRIRITSPAAGAPVSAPLTVSGDFDVAPNLTSGESLIVWIDCDFAVIPSDSAPAISGNTWSATFTSVSGCSGQSATLNVFIYPNGPSDSKPISI